MKKKKTINNKVKEEYVERREAAERLEEVGDIGVIVERKTMRVSSAAERPLNASRVLGKQSRISAHPIH